MSYLVHERKYHHYQLGSILGNYPRGGAKIPMVCLEFFCSPPPRILYTPPPNNIICPSLSSIRSLPPCPPLGYALVINTITIIWNHANSYKNLPWQLYICILCVMCILYIGKVHTYMFTIKKSNTFRRPFYWWFRKGRAFLWNCYNQGI